jgi:hypothetical protein
VGVTSVIAVTVLTLPSGNVVVFLTVDVERGVDEVDDVVVGTNEEDGVEVDKFVGVEDGVVDGVVVGVGVGVGVVDDVVLDEVGGGLEVVEGGVDDGLVVDCMVDVSVVVTVEPCTVVSVVTTVLVSTGMLGVVVEALRLPVALDLLTKVNKRLASCASS